MEKRSILIGSLSGPNFSIRTAKMDRSRTDLLSWKDIQTRENVLTLSRNPFFLLSDQNVWQKFCENGVIKTNFVFL